MWASGGKGAPSFSRYWRGAKRFSCVPRARDPGGMGVRPAAADDVAAAADAGDVELILKPRTCVPSRLTRGDASLRVEKVNPTAA